MGAKGRLLGQRPPDVDEVGFPSHQRQESWKKLEKITESGLSGKEGSRDAADGRKRFTCDVCARKREQKGRLLLLLCPLLYTLCQVL